MSKKLNVLAAFSEEGSGKSVLSFTKLNRDLYNKIIIISSGEIDIKEDFGFKITRITGDFPEDIFNNIYLLITGTGINNNFELQLIKTARNKNIQSMSFIDHWTNLLLRFKDGSNYIFPDKILVIDKKAKEIAIKEGIKSNLIHINGNPYYKYLEKWRPKISRIDFLESINIFDNKEYILYTPEPLLKYRLNEKYGFSEIDGLNVIHDSIQRNNRNLSLIVKSHPSDNGKLLESHLNKFNQDNYHFIKTCNINNLIYYSILNIGFFSNSLIESSILKVKTIRLLFLLENLNLDPLSNCRNDFLNLNKEEELDYILSNLKI